MNFVDQYIRETKEILDAVSREDVEEIVTIIRQCRDVGGRLFILGVGGSAGHASHAVNDFRKICGVEAYSPSDNVSELTARVNDEGWETSYSEWLRVSNLNSKDCLLIFSVGGGDPVAAVSMNIIRSIDLACERKASICGVVGRDGGHTKKVADACLVVKPIQPDRITPHTEGICAVLWHLMVSHPELQANDTKWESISN